MILAVYFIGFTVALFLCAGMFYSEIQFFYSPDIANRDRRKDIRSALFVGIVEAIIWPVGLVLCLFLSGFAKHGIWRSNTGLGAR